MYSRYRSVEKNINYMSMKNIGKYNGKIRNVDVKFENNIEKMPTEMRAEPRSQNNPDIDLNIDKNVSTILEKDYAKNSHWYFTWFFSSETQDHLPG